MHLKDKPDSTQGCISSQTQSLAMQIQSVRGEFAEFEGKMLPKLHMSEEET
ncbi:MAG: hypothetical protein JRN68_06865 [Nitrososphaerota archaeon]|nr:hypothetical protein [Nitrososphaerota archaeon]